ncbi:TonB-dependent receptor plug domain-containing protein [Calditrichota bacterium LG25]
MLKHFVFLLFIIGFATAQDCFFTLQVRDIWSGDPVPHALLLVNQDTLRTDQNGIVKLAVFDSLSAVKITAGGYFSEQLSIKNLKTSALVYLIPIRQTTYITVVGRRFYSSPTGIPSHKSVLLFNGLANNQDIPRALSLQSGAFLKSYGPPGSLQSISIRGMSSEQTQVLLDGIPLNNLQLGGVDFSLFAGADIDALEIYRGSSPLLGGSGAVGGTIHLQSAVPAEELRLKLYSGRSSLGNRSLAAQLHFPFKKFKNLLTFNHANGLNHYSVRQDGETVDLRNRDFRQNFLSFKTLFEPIRSMALSVRFSHFKKAAGSPRPFTNRSGEEVNKARLNIDNTLIHGVLRYLQNDTEFYLSAYLRNEWMAYDDPVLILNNQPLHSIHFNQEKGLQGRIHYSPRQSLLIKSGMEYARQNISSSEAGKHGRSRASFYVLSDWQALENCHSLQAFHFNSGFRIEQYSGQPALFLPTAGISLQWPVIQLFASLGKNFRMPSFNDLYWVPGGNPQLKPETSVNAEVGFRAQKAFGLFLTGAEISHFQNRVQDQIKWLPGANGLWQPFNIAAVKSRGIETDFTLSDLTDRHKITFTYTYTQTLKDKAEYDNDPTVGNQLPFLPVEQAALILQTAWRNWRIELSGHYASFRYLDFSNDPQRIVPSYFESHLKLSYLLEFKNVSLRPALQIENLLNKQYAILPGYPMPGRYLNVHLSMQLNNSNKGG